MRDEPDEATELRAIAAALDELAAALEQVADRIAAALRGARAEVPRTDPEGDSLVTQHRRK